MSEETQQPPICAITVMRQQPANMPNRWMRRNKFVKTAEGDFKEGSVQLLSNITDGGLLVVLPDGSGYYVNPTLLVNECVHLWRQENAPEPEPSPAPVMDNPSTT